MTKLFTSSPVEIALAKSELQERLFGRRIDVELGRYIVQEKIGAGGMGIVYLATDPELKREVALKLLHPRPGETEATEASLGQEASALARVTHPNVVAVHDVGTYEGHRYVAMEYVDGHTLRAWLEARRSEPARRDGWREILSVFLQAARGLAEVHAKGLVHSDFKPENVLLTAEGRVKVVDFGLARAPTCTRERETTDPSRGGSSSADTTSGRAGTLPYMSPEQLTNAPVGEQSDQYSFCVALYEALYGARPFDGSTPSQLLEQIRAGVARTPRAHKRCPRWLDRIVRRGLEADPERRWPSMIALIDACELRLAPRRRALWVLVLATLATSLSLAAAGVFQRSNCRASAALEGTWSDDIAREFTAELRRAGYSDALVDPLRRELDAYGQRWSDRATVACEAHHYGFVRGDIYDLQVACLERLRSGLSEVVTVLRHAAPGTVTGALEAVSSLEGVDRCGDTEALLRRAETLPAPPDDETRREVARQRGDLRRVKALQDAGLVREGRTLAQRVVKETRESPHKPVRAEAMMWLGRLQEAVGQHEAARATLQEAYLLAEELGHDEVVIDSSTELVRVLGEALSRPEEALFMARVGEARLDGAQPSDKIRRAALLSRRAGVHQRQGANELALEALERTLAIVREVYGPEHHEYGFALHNVAVSLDILGLDARALEMYRDALVVQERTLGAEHPALARNLSSLGALEGELGEPDAAARHLERARALLETAEIREHELYPVVLNNIASLAETRGEFARAEALYREALGLVQRVLAPDHAFAAMMTMNIGNTLKARGRAEESFVYYQRALEMLDASVRSSEARGLVLWNLGEAQVDAGRLDDAERTIETWRALVLDAHGEDDPRNGDPLAALGRLALARGDCTKAQVALHEAERLGDGFAPPADLAKTRFLLAQSLAASDHPHERARALALCRESERALKPDERHASLLARVRRFRLQLERSGRARATCELRNDTR